MDLNAPVSERVAEQIRLGIINGHFEPGERLTEAALAEWLNVSNIPVREAFRQLEPEGLIVKEPRRGTYVRSFSEADVAHLYMVRGALDRVAYTLVLARDGDKDDLITELRRIVKKQRQGIEAGDYQRAIDLDLEFHATVYDYAGSELLKRFWSVMCSQLRVLLSWRLASELAHDGHVERFNVHWATIEALADGDLETLLAKTERRYAENSAQFAQVLRERQTLPESDGIWSEAD